MAFSDANATLEPDALRELVAPFADPAVGYVCGQVTFVNEAGTNQEGLYWRYEMRCARSSRAWRSVTGGNGALYATRREAYLVVDPVMGHDLSFPFNLVRRGWRCVYRPTARATEKMVPSIEGEWARKRRMMSHAWPIVVRGGLLDPRGWPARYTLMIASHRWLRYAAPFLHLAAALALAAAARTLLAARRRRARPAAPRPLLVARYYVLTQASIALRALRLAAPRHRGRLGRRRRARGDAPRCSTSSSPASRSCVTVAGPPRRDRRRSGSSRTGHPIYRQRRIGKDGRPFDMLKLRTMVAGAESMGSGLAVNEGDPRITRVGAFLRRFSIDELPNLVNVLRGDMAIVGPRPTVQVQVAQYTERQRGRLAVRPGLTGWAQVNGRASLQWDERIELDLWYIEHRSWRLDLRIILRTARDHHRRRGDLQRRTGGWKS